MSPITHGLLSWVLAERSLKNERDVALVTVAGLAPDIDSLGIVVDLTNSWLGRPPTDYYASLHHWLFHGVAGALAISTVVALQAKDKVKVFSLSLLVFHLHLLCDVVGSRGPDPSEGIWPIYYLGPFSRHDMVIAWANQWLLNGWQNISLTVLLLGWTFYVTWRWARSPLSPWIPKAHHHLVEALRGRFGPSKA